MASPDVVRDGLGDLARLAIGLGFCLVLVFAASLVAAAIPPIPWPER